MKKQTPLSRRSGLQLTAYRAQDICKAMRAAIVGLVESKEHREAFATPTGPISEAMLASAHTSDTPAIVALGAIYMIAKLDEKAPDAAQSEVARPYWLDGVQIVSALYRRLLVLLDLEQEHNLPRSA